MGKKAVPLCKAWEPRPGAEKKCAWLCLIAAGMGDC